jgi:hypothetical protein
MVFILLVRHSNPEHVIEESHCHDGKCTYLTRDLVLLERKDIPILSG